MKKQNVKEKVKTLSIEDDILNLLGEWDNIISRFILAKDHIISQAGKDKALKSSDLMREVMNEISNKRK